LIQLATCSDNLRASNDLRYETNRPQSIERLATVAILTSLWANRMNARLIWKNAFSRHLNSDEAGWLQFVGNRSVPRKPFANQAAFA
jgi:hypothetical protein